MDNGLPSYDREILARLLSAAKLPLGRITTSVMGGSGVVNRHYLVSLPEGERYVARIYEWPFLFFERLDRREREARLLPQLAAAGVDCPNVVATVSAPGRGGSLMTHIGGTLLGEVASSRGLDIGEAWREAGRSLRVLHEVPVPVQDRELLKLGGPLVRIVKSWSEWHMTDILESAAIVSSAEHLPPVDVRSVERVVMAAESHLQAVPLVVLHGDAHPWNVMVERDMGGDWACRGWLDWEWAWLGDPDYDLMRNSVMRFEDIGETRPEFYEGYGRVPGRLTPLYELGFMLLCAVHGRSVPGLEPMVRDAMEYLSSFAEKLGSVRRAVEEWR